VEKFNLPKSKEIPSTSLQQSEPIKKKSVREDVSSLPPSKKPEADAYYNKGPKASPPKTTDMMNKTVNFQKERLNLSMASGEDANRLAPTMASRYGAP
jgi:hypothetical protein